MTLDFYKTEEEKGGEEENGEHLNGHIPIINGIKKIELVKCILTIGIESIGDIMIEIKDDNYTIIRRFNLVINTSRGFNPDLNTLHFNKSEEECINPVILVDEIKILHFKIHPTEGNELPNFKLKLSYQLI